MSTRSRSLVEDGDVQLENTEIYRLTHCSFPIFRLITLSALKWKQFSIYPNIIILDELYCTVMKILLKKKNPECLQI